MTDTVTLQQPLPLQKATWDEFDSLDANLLRGIYGYGFEAPSEIQQKALPALMAGRDVVAQAQSGTGKTGAFVVGALSRIDTAHNAVQALLVSPTKELALQTANVARAIGGMMEPPLRVAVLYGGVDTASVIGGGGERPHIICGCPGRIYDIMTNSRFHVGAGTGGGQHRHPRSRSGPAPVPLLNPEKDIRIVVLDEADELLKPEAEPRRGITVAPEDERMGFREQMYHVFQHLATSVQVALFTATMPAYMDGLIEKIMNSPEIIKVAPEQLTLEGIRQYYVNVYNDYDKLGAMREIYKDGAITQSIVYCNTVTRVIGLYNEMLREGFPVCCIHGEMSREEREVVLAAFKAGKHRILISSDLTARGIDVQQVGLVINYDIPTSKYVYLHRIGRSGRWGRKGVGINLVTQRRGDVRALEDIERYYRCQLEDFFGGEGGGGKR